MLKLAKWFCKSSEVGRTLGRRPRIRPSFDVLENRLVPSGFGPNEDWTDGPYYSTGRLGTFFADVTGDGRADAIVVNADTVTVRRSTGSGFGPNEDWTGGPYYGSLGTFFADVTGDGRADAIVVNADKVTVRRSIP
jgi:hypothetical protein